MSTAWIALGMMLQSLQLSTGNFPKPLTEEEERYYVARSAEGDTAARNVLIERNLRLVAHIMKKYYASESDQEDLISIGTIGLIKAVNTYRPDKNIKLATYASRCIENAILTSARLSMRAARQQKTGNRLGSGLFPVSFLYGHDDRVQQLQLLPGRAVQIFQPLTDSPSVNL